MMLTWRPEGLQAKSARPGKRRRTPVLAPRWRPSLEALEDRLVPAPVIEVFLANGPSPPSPSPGFTGAAPAIPPGFDTRATTGLQVTPPAASGDPTQTPSAFVPGPSGTRIT